MEISQQNIRTINQVYLDSIENIALDLYNYLKDQDAPFIFNVYDEDLGVVHYRLVDTTYLEEHLDQDDLPKQEREMLQPLLDFVEQNDIDEIII